MKLKMFIQVVEVGHWEPWDFDADHWVREEVIRDADEVNIYLADSCKKDVGFAGGAFYSPRLKCFRFNYEFVGINEIPY